MNTTHTLKGITAEALLSGGLGLAALGLGAGTAQADGPHHWCPGDPKNMPYVVNGDLDWDWNVCHTWYATNYGQGNITMAGRPTAIWDGDNPPPDAITRRVCPPIAFMCP
ncbi:hypothetical protein [Mycobacterium sp.]|jgi:hypothetical protein|uniref:hypothetical protein n=1 Tax=Mycobacterium sp. TaxID=1785 RepID=UPI00333E6640|nr:hypothetical protein [Mycobacterium sp.]